MPHRNLSDYSLAVILMLSGIFCFALMDAAAKYLTGSIGVLMALWARYAGQSLIVITLVSRRKGVWRAHHPYLQIVRSVLLLSATGFFFSAIHALGIPMATALMEMNPVLITLGGALFLRELLGPQRIIGIAISLVGALIVIRPGFQTFQIEMLYPIAAASCYASYSLVTRYVGQREDVWTSLLYTGLVGGILTTLALPFFWVTPAFNDIVVMIAIACVGTTGQLFIIRSFSKAEAGAVAPFAYAGLIYAAFLSIIIYGEYPDQWTVVGSIVIALAGIYVWHRESKAKSGDIVSMSNRQKRLEVLGDYLSNFVFIGLIRAALLLPYETRVRLMGRIVDRFVSPLAGWPRRIQNNLNYVMPELNASEVKRLTHGVATTVGRMIVEMYSGKEYFDRMYDAEISGEGLEPMLEAYATGRPLILVTGHYANYIAIGPTLQKLGITIGVLYRPMENRFFDKHYVDAISYFSDPQFPQTKQGIVKMVRHIRKGGVMGILTDVRAPEGARTTFMGQPAATSTVISDLAIKYGALLVPIYGVRQPNGLDFKVEVHKPIALTDALTMTQQINDDLEGMVRRHPEQWFWVHKRWKLN